MKSIRPLITRLIKALQSEEQQPIVVEYQDKLDDLDARAPWLEEEENSRLYKELSDQYAPLIFPGPEEDYERAYSIFRRVTHFYNIGIKEQSINQLDYYNGLFHYMSDNIVICSELNIRDKLIVISHELGHGLTHKWRMGSELTRTQREVDADVFSYLCLSQMGFDVVDKIARGISFLYGKDDNIVDNIKDAADKITKYKWWKTFLNLISGDQPLALSNFFAYFEHQTDQQFRRVFWEKEYEIKDHLVSSSAKVRQFVSEYDEKLGVLWPIIDYPFIEDSDGVLRFEPDFSLCWLRWNEQLHCNVLWAGFQKGALTLKELMGFYARLGCSIVEFLSIFEEKILASKGKK